MKTAERNFMRSAKAKPYLCTCADCGHRFCSGEIPLPKRRGPLASISAKKSAVPATAEGHRELFAAPVEDGSLKSTVPCPQCGSRNVRFCAVVD